VIIIQNSSHIEPSVREHKGTKEYTDLITFSFFFVSFVFLCAFVRNFRVNVNVAFTDDLDRGKE